MNDNKTKAQLIWDDIKGKNINIFGLQNQIISKYCVPLFFDDEKLHLKYSAGAILPAIEECLNKLYSVDLEDRFIVVSKLKE